MIALHSDRNSFNRWAEVFSDTAREIALRHVQNGGSFDQTDPVRGMTVERLKVALTKNCPGEDLPDDAVLFIRIGLLQAQLARQSAIDQFREANDLGRILMAALEHSIGDRVSNDFFSDVMDD